MRIVVEVDDEVGALEPAVEPQHGQGGHAGRSLDEQMGNVGEERQGEQKRDGLPYRFQGI